MSKLQSLHVKIKELRDLMQEVAFASENMQEAALCETAGDVIGGLDEAFDHFLQTTGNI